MEKWQRKQMEAPSHWRGQNNPSFSSSLLEAVYRSIDESDGGSHGLALPSASKTQSKHNDKNWFLQTPTPAYICRPRDVSEQRGHRCLFSTSSSSECSSFGGFSSSDTDYVTRPRPVLTRCTGIQSNPPQERKRPSSIRSRIRSLRSLGKPGSPGTRLSAFLNAIFPGSSGIPTKPKFAAGEEESDTSSVKSFISKMPTSLRGEKQRSVRPTPISNAPVRDVQPARSCGNEQHYGGDTVAARNSRLMVEELLRRIEMEEEDSDCESVSSSELFELDSLCSVGQLQDELPVFETTSLGANRAIVHEFTV